MINLKQLLTENTSPKAPVLEAADHVRNGLEKVFAAGNVEISYRQCEHVGLGYIKSISEAIKVSTTESRKLAKTFGYRDDETHKKFIKEDNDFSKIDAQSPEGTMAKQSAEELPHDEKDMSNPEENEEVKLAKKIVLAASLLRRYVKPEEGTGVNATIRTIEECAQKLIAMHGAQ